MPSAPHYPVLYLVEQFSPENGEVLESDVCARLDVAIQKIYQFLEQYPEIEVRVEVSEDEDGEIEGVGVFSDDSAMLGCVTTYHLDRDTEPVTVPGLLSAMNSSRESLQSKLTQLFSQRKV